MGGDAGLQGWGEGGTPCRRLRCTLTSHYAVLLLLEVLLATSGSSRCSAFLLLSVRLSMILGNRIRSLPLSACLAVELLVVATSSAEVRRGAGIEEVTPASRVLPTGRGFRVWSPTGDARRADSLPSPVLRLRPSRRTPLFVSTISVFRRMSRARRLWGGRLGGGAFEEWSPSSTSCSSRVLELEVPLLSDACVLMLETRPRRREAVDDEEVSELVPILGRASGMKVFSRRRGSRCLASVLRTGVDASLTAALPLTSLLLWVGMVLGTLRIETEVLCLVRPTGRWVGLGLVDLVGVGDFLNLATLSPDCAGDVLLTLPRGDTDFFEEGILSLGIPVSCLWRRGLAVTS